MKKLMLIIIAVFVSVTAQAQLRSKFNDGILSHEFVLGEYVFSGFGVKGCYDLSYCPGFDDSETDTLYNFIKENMESINKKYGVNIVKVVITDAVKFIDLPPYRVHGGSAVKITIIDTELREKILKAEEKERTDRINSLQNIF